MSEMTERVSCAIFDTIWPTQEWNGEEAICRAVSEAAARSAIRAMREPTDIMDRAGAEILVHPSVYQEGAPATQKKKASMMFSAMIDAAISTP